MPRTMRARTCEGGKPITITATAVYVSPDYARDVAAAGGLPRPEPPIYCTQCGHTTAANGACYRCHPIPPPQAPAPAGGAE